MDLDEILKRVEPRTYDDKYSKEYCLEVLENHPDLQKNLTEQLFINQEWQNKAAEERIFFLITNDSWKFSNTLSYPDSIQLKLIGMQKIPTISINFRLKPV